MDNSELIKTIVITVLTSSGFTSALFAFLQKLADKKDIKTKMLIGLGHDRIVYLGMKYIERGWITKDEYENLQGSGMAHDRASLPTSGCEESCQQIANG